MKQKKKKPTQKNTKRNDQEILVPVFRAGCFRSRHSVVFIFFLSMFNSQRSVWLGPSGIFFFGFPLLGPFLFCRSRRCRVSICISRDGHRWVDVLVRGSFVSVHIFFRYFMAWPFAQDDAVIPYFCVSFSSL